MKAMADLWPTTWRVSGSTLSPDDKDDWPLQSPLVSDSIHQPPPLSEDLLAELATLLGEGTIHLLQCPRCRLPEYSATYSPSKCKLLPSQPLLSYTHDIVCCGPKPTSLHSGGSRICQTSGCFRGPAIWGYNGVIIRSWWTTWSMRRCPS